MTAKINSNDKILLFNAKGSGDAFVLVMLNKLLVDDDLSDVPSSPGKALELSLHKERKTK